MDSKIWNQGSSTRIWFSACYFHIIQIRGEPPLVFSCLFQNCCIKFFPSIMKMLFSYQVTFFFKKNTHIMLPNCDWYLIPLYTNIHKQKTSRHICYSTPWGVPVPSTSPLFTDSLSSSPVTTQKEQTHRYVYTEVIAKSISPKTSTKGSTELLFTRVHTELEVVLKSRCLKRWWYLEHWRVQEAIRR